MIKFIVIALFALLIAHWLVVQVNSVVEWATAPVVCLGDADCHAKFPRACPPDQPYCF